MNTSTSKVSEETVTIPVSRYKQLLEYEQIGKDLYPILKGESE